MSRLCRTIPLPNREGLVLVTSYHSKTKSRPTQIDSTVSRVNRRYKLLTLCTNGEKNIQSRVVTNSSISVPGRPGSCRTDPLGVDQITNMTLHFSRHERNTGLEREEWSLFRTNSGDEGNKGESHYRQTSD